MASARIIVTQKLLSVSAVTAVVGQKIWPSKAEQNSPGPYILVHKPGQVNEQILEGDAGYPQSRVSLECVGRTAIEAETLGNLVFAALKNVTNETIENGQSPTTVFGRDVTIIPSDFDVDDYSDDRKAFRRIIDFYIYWRSP